MASLRRSVLVSALFTLFGGPGIVLGYLPYTHTHFQIPSSEPLWQMVLAVVFIVMGLIPLLESILRFVRVGRGTLMPLVPTEHLVVSGLYRYVRNPMYVGVLTVLAGEALLFQSRWVAGYAAIVWLVIEFFVFFYEEPALRRRYGEEYVAYCERVSRWWPRLRASA